MFKNKTFKREVAVLALCFLFYIATQEASEDKLAVLTWPTFLFAGAAFGMDWAKKAADFTFNRKEEV